MTSDKKHTWTQGAITRTAPSDGLDFYRTWPAATRAICRLENLSEVGAIWEPACGDGAMSRVMIAEGCHVVVSSDLYDRGYRDNHHVVLSPIDFLNEYCPGYGRIPAIVTNPPFNLIEPFINRALQVATKRVVMLGRLAFLEGIKRGPWFRESALTRVWVSSRRIPMGRYEEELKGNLATMTAFAWYVWDLGDLEYPTLGSPRIGWFDWKNYEEEIGEKT